MSGAAPKPVMVGGVAVGGRDITLIAGPCVIETRRATLAIASRLKEIAGGRGVPLIFKASFDKANRTSPSAYRGPGIDIGLEILSDVKARTGLPVLTDIHEAWQAEKAAQIVDCLQIPAFLCRQTDLIMAAAATGLPVNIKKGQFVTPQAMEHAVAKAGSAGKGGVILTERGTSFGYGALVVDYRSLAIMRSLGAPVIFDGTHSVQAPGGLGSAAGGERRFVLPLVRAAVAVGVDGIFTEVHPHPDKALSDGPNSIDYTMFKWMVSEVLAIRGALVAR